MHSINTRSVYRSNPPVSHQLTPLQEVTCYTCRFTQDLRCVLTSTSTKGDGLTARTVIDLISHPKQDHRQAWPRAGSLTFTPCNHRRHHSYRRKLMAQHKHRRILLTSESIGIKCCCLLRWLQWRFPFFLLGCVLLCCVMGYRDFYV